MNTAQKLLIAAVGLGTAIPLYSHLSGRAGTGGTVGANDPGSRLVADAQRAERSGVLVETTGIVQHVGPDATVDSGDQRLLIRLSADVAIPVVHSVRAAPPVPARVGDRIRVRGWYHWNEQGGVIVGSHTDAEGEEREGWILHEGRFYEAAGALEAGAGRGRPARVTD